MTWRLPTWRETFFPAVGPRHELHHFHILCVVEWFIILKEYLLLNWLTLAKMFVVGFRG